MICNGFATSWQAFCSQATSRTLAVSSCALPFLSLLITHLHKYHVLLSRLLHVLNDAQSFEHNFWIIFYLYYADSYSVR